MNVVAAVIGSCALAAIAAAIGHYNTHARRAQRQARREQVAALCRHQDITARVQGNVAGRLAVHTEESVWLDLLAEHPELRTRACRKRGA